MMGDWAAVLETTALAVALKGSVWAYPLVNAGHILGVALLVGSIVSYDLRLLGAWPTVPISSFRPVSRSTAAVGLALAIVCGALLFITRATDYAASALFSAKMGVVTVGILNALLFQAIVTDDVRLSQSTRRPYPAAVKASAGISLTVWPAALLLGRLIGYF